MLIVAVTLSLLPGCASIVSSATGSLAASLQGAILNSDDPATVASAMPAYLLLVDGLLADYPDSVDMLLAGAQLNGSFGAAFVTDEARLQQFSAKALDYAQRAACLELKNACSLRTGKFETFQAWVNDLELEDVPVAYALASAWAGWIQANSDDWNAVGELGRVRALITRIAELDERYDYGGPHLYMGVFETLAPPAMGGRPEVGREHFERAIQISDGRHLLTRVMFAEQYARLVFDQELHDSLLQEVLEADPKVDDLTLINRVAQQRAQALLDGSAEYFE